MIVETCIRCRNMQSQGIQAQGPTPDANVVRQNSLDLGNVGFVDAREFSHLLLLPWVERR